jgi:hypothetical protein
MLAYCGAKFGIVTNILLYYKFLSNLDDSYDSSNKRIYEQRNVTKVIMKLRDKLNVKRPDDGFDFQSPQIFISS